MDKKRDNLIQKELGQKNQINAHGWKNREQTTLICIFLFPLRFLICNIIFNVFLNFIHHWNSAGYFTPLMVHWCEC